ncbi:hypothetical protein [Glutamicibacter halophytocola]|nr:hypothetical protein [Glutamicibacter halophytocola]
MELNDPQYRYGRLEVDDIDGWWNPPSRKNQDSARVNSDGDYGSENYFEARYVSITGAFVAKGESERWKGANALAALLSTGPKLMTVSIDGDVQTAMVKATDQPDLKWLAPRLAEYTIQVKADDPYKYGERREVSVASGGSDTVFHRGTVGAWPSVALSGSMPDGYTVTIGGQSVSVPMGLASGESHRIDYRRRRLYINGSLFMGAFGSQNFRSIPPGLRTAVSLSASSGSGTAEVTVNDTYI